MKSSIIIRVKNEKVNLEKLLKILQNQINQEFEIIIVDNNSTDGSGKIVYDYFPKNRIQNIKLKKFTYPKACNEGAGIARNNLFVYLSAHSYPISNTWLDDGLKLFNDKNVVGVFAYPRQSINDISIAEFFCYSIPNYLRAPTRFQRQGELGNTNSIIKREFWEKHKFDERLMDGSEDYEWSRYWRLKGKKIINEPKFSVFHTHHLGFIEIFRRQMKWRRSRIQIDKNLNNKLRLDHSG